jgi:hypothetical protein
MRINYKTNAGGGTKTARGLNRFENEINNDDDWMDTGAACTTPRRTLAFLLLRGPVNR